MAATALALSSPAPTLAVTRYVAPRGDDAAACTAAAPCRSFGRAYEIASAGDVVEVAAGTYGPQALAGGSKPVTFKGVPGNAVRQLANAASHVIFDGLRVDGGGAKLVAFYNSASDVTFRHGSIGDVVDERGALVGGERLLFDDVLFHDVRQIAPDVHNECLFIINPERLILRNSTFRNCATMDVNMNWPGYLSPTPPAYGHVTLENNVFGHSTKGRGWHSYGFVLGGTGAVGDAPGCARGAKAAVYLRGWRVVNNTFENAVIVGDGDNGCGDGTNIWANNIGTGWSCLPGVIFAGNVGQKCGATDTAARVSPDWFADSTRWDFHLAASTPPVGVASPTYATATDRDGRTRDARPDAGAYEHGAALHTVDTSPAPSGTSIGRRPVAMILLVAGTAALVGAAAAALFARRRRTRARSRG